MGYPGRQRFLDARMPDETARFFNPTTAQFVNSGHYRVDPNLRLKDSKLLSAPTIARWMDGEILSEAVLPAPSSVTPLDEVDLLVGATAEVEMEREVINELKKVSVTEQVEHANPIEQITSVEHAKMVEQAKPLEHTKPPEQATPTAKVATMEKAEEPTGEPTEHTAMVEPMPSEDHATAMETEVVPIIEEPKEMPKPRTRKVYPERTRFSARIRGKTTPNAVFQSMAGSITIPESVEEALKHEEWYRATVKEMEGHIAAGTYRIVDIPEGRKLIDTLTPR